MPFLRAKLLKNKPPELKPEEDIIQPVATAPLPNIPDDIETIEEVQDQEEIKEIKNENESKNQELESELESAVQELPELEEQENKEVESQDEGQEEEKQEENSLPEEIPGIPTESEPDSKQEHNEPENPESESVDSGDSVEPEETIEAVDIKPQYDFTSGERYVDKVSTKTEFDKVLDSLAAISKDLLSHEVERFAKKYADKYQGDFTKAEADAKKYEAFLGGYITNAAMTLYENNYMDAAIRQLDQAKNVLIASQKLKTETSAIKERVEEEGAAVDLSDILGMFGDG